MPVFKNPIAQRCARWILLATSPAPLPMLHPVRDDMAAAADEIERLGKILLGACQRARSCQHPAGCICDIDPTTMDFPGPVEGLNDTIVQLIHKHVAMDVRNELFGVEEAAEAIEAACLSHLSRVRGADHG